jgi:hypothetical protein
MDSPSADETKRIFGTKKESANFREVIQPADETLIDKIIHRMMAIHGETDAPTETQTVYVPHPLEYYNVMCYGYTEPITLTQMLALQSEFEQRIIEVSVAPMAQGKMDHSYGCLVVMVKTALFVKREAMARATDSMPIIHKGAMRPRPSRKEETGDDESSDHAPVPRRRIVRGRRTNGDFQDDQEVPPPVNRVDPYAANDTRERLKRKATFAGREEDPEEGHRQPKANRRDFNDSFRNGEPPVSVVQSDARFNAPTRTPQSPIGNIGSERERNTGIVSSVAGWLNFMNY